MKNIFQRLIAFFTGGPVDPEQKYLTSPKALRGFINAAVTTRQFTKAEQYIEGYVRYHEDERDRAHFGYLLEKRKQDLFALQCYVRFERNAVLSKIYKVTHITNLIRYAETAQDFIQAERLMQQYHNAYSDEKVLLKYWKKMIADRRTQLRLIRMNVHPVPGVDCA